MGCEDESSEVGLDMAGYEYLSFGHLYGLCQGEECVEIFRIDESGVFEDTKDEYPSRSEAYKGDFSLKVDIDPASFELLITTFPEALLNEEEVVLGCPDCADQGGYYIEIAKLEGTKRFWILDTNKSSVPAYAHAYMDSIFEAIKMINE